jgi:hypothetical protein
VALDFAMRGNKPVQRHVKHSAIPWMAATLYEQAFIIAETQILLGRIRAARVAAIERARALPKSEPPLIPG